MIKYLALFFFVSSCALVKERQEKVPVDRLQCKVFSIKEFTRSYRFMAINDRGDTILLTSLKENQRETSAMIADTIFINKHYDFEAVRVNPRTGTMEQLGAFIITGNDTVWTAPSYKNIPPAYALCHVNGLLLLKPSCR